MRYLRYCFLLYILACNYLASGQNFVVPHLQQLVYNGNQEALQDSLAQGEFPEKTKLYYQLWQYIYTGRYNEAEGKLSGFSEKELGLTALLLPKVHIYLGLGKEPEAHEILNKLTKIKTKDENLLQTIKRVQQWAQDYSRMLHTAKNVIVLDKYTAPQQSVLNILSQLTKQLGTTSKEVYEAPNQSLRLHALKQGGLGVSFRLGNDSWETPIPLTIKGMPQGTIITYPWLSTDGSTLYFCCSDSVNQSGKELYVTRWDRQSGQLLVPQRLPFPYNSQANDYLYCPLGTNNEVLLLTNRETTNPNQLTLYLVKEVNSSSTSATPHLPTLPVTQSGILEQRLATAATPTTRKDSPVLFRWQGRTIRSEKDLKQPAAKKLLQTYITLVKQLEQDKKNLHALRKQWANQPHTHQTQTANAILTLEHEVTEKNKSVAALRNEIIRTETVTQ